MAILQTIRHAFFDSTGNPLSGGKVYTYSAGTTTPKDTYTDQGGLTANANPVILDSRGEASIWFNGSYKVVLKTAADATIYTVDNIQDPSTGFVTTTGIETLTNKTLTSPTMSSPTMSGSPVTSGGLNATGGAIVSSSSGLTSGVGYGTGAGGTVTQLTSKSTAVALEKLTGYILTHNAALAANTAVTFTLTNTSHVAGDIYLASVYNNSNYSVRVSTFNGGAYFTLTNETGGSLSDAVTIRFVVFKCVSA